ncbi:hypothetical protein K456DRAFT_1765559 [Colletotrichum gloeosporioides 23]|nr:hypothetical protein K456DRAFT_1765559 [Colletotrichum gloeosporioides 23]
MEGFLLLFLLLLLPSDATVPLIGRASDEKKKEKWPPPPLSEAGASRDPVGRQVQTQTGPCWTVRGVTRRNRRKERGRGLAGPSTPSRRLRIPLVGAKNSGAAPGTEGTGQHGPDRAQGRKHHEYQYQYRRCSSRSRSGAGSVRYGYLGVPPKAGMPLPLFSTETTGTGTFPPLLAQGILSSCPSQDALRRAWQNVQVWFQISAVLLGVSFILLPCCLKWMEATSGCCSFSRTLELFAATEAEAVAGAAKAETSNSCIRRPNSTRLASPRLGRSTSWTGLNQGPDLNIVNSTCIALPPMAVLAIGRLCFASTGAAADEARRGSERVHLQCSAVQCSAVQCGRVPNVRPPPALSTSERKAKVRSGRYFLTTK